MNDPLTTVWLEKLRGGDSLAAQRIWQHYYERLIRFARQRLVGSNRRVADEEDVVAVAFNSFYRGVEAGRFPQLEDRDDLWQVLVMLVGRKAVDQLQYEHRLKRGGGKVKGESIYGKEGELQGGIYEVVGAEPTPAFAAQMMEELHDRLETLDDDVLRRVALAKLEGYTNDEIAAQLDCGLRTVERKLRLIRSIWQHDIPE